MDHVRLRVSKNSALIAAILAAAAWGSAMSLSKGALRGLPPVTLLAVQLAASNALLWSVVLARRMHLPPRRQVLRFCAVGLLEPGLAYLFGLIGLSLTTASASSLLQSSESFTIMGLSVVILRERIHAIQALLALMALVGVIMVAGAPAEGLALDGKASLGGGLVFIGSCCAALYVVLSSRFVVDHEPVLVLAIQQASALGLAVIAMLVEWRYLPSNPLLGLSAGALTLAIISGVVQYAIAFWLYLTALRGLSASFAGILLNLIPIFGVTCAFVFLGERLTGVQWVGTTVLMVALIAFAWHQNHTGAGAHSLD